MPIAKAWLSTGEHEVAAHMETERFGWNLDESGVNEFIRRHPLSNGETYHILVNRDPARVYGDKSW